MDRERRVFLRAFHSLQHRLLTPNLLCQSRPPATSQFVAVDGGKAESAIVSNSSALWESKPTQSHKIEEGLWDQLQDLACRASCAGQVGLSLVEIEAGPMI